MDVNRKRQRKSRVRMLLAASVRPLLALTVLSSLHSTNALSFEAFGEGRLYKPDPPARRLFLLSLPAVTSVAIALPAQARNIDVGTGGVDLFSSVPPTSPADALYPISMEGPWTVQRIVTSVEGDAFQAETAWRTLGGSGGFQKTETFLTKFLIDPKDSGSVILDRGYERTSRSANDKSALWSPENPNKLKTDKVNIAVVQRKVESPTDEGFGFNELYSITEGQIFERAARVQRRYRRAYDAAGNRMVEGLEIQKTYRVMDGVAGTEFPTSTTKSMIRMKRPVD